MVNLRKVSAVATGALFVGATLGMAAAVTVPADFKASMLADQGIAKAQLVVGKDAPGKVADTASAEVIQEAAKTKLAYTVPGGDIEIAYGHFRWDDTPSTTMPNLSWQTPDGIELGKTVKTTDDKVDGKIINVHKGIHGYLRIDKNADGDFEDTKDYNIYSGLYVVDGSAGTVQFVYNFSTDRDSTYSTNIGGAATQYFEPGVTFKVKGKLYTLTEIDGAKEIKLGPTLRASTTGTTQDFAASATTLDGTKKVAYRHDPAQNVFALYFYDGTDFLGSVDISSGSDKFEYGDNSTGGRIKDTELPSAFQAYKLWTKTSGSTAYVWAVRRDDEISVVDEQRDVLGYYQVRVNNKSANEFSPGGRGLYFLDAPLSLVLGSTVDVPGTEYEIKWETDKTLKLKRKTSVTVGSGTKMDKDMSDYKDFLKEDIKPTLTGVGETREPVLEIVDEDTASSSMNLVLIGGPVANKLVAELVTTGKSKVDWYTSEGDIEVISDYPSPGFSGIIVAGMTRKETAAAAEALAAAL